MIRLRVRLLLPAAACFLLVVLFGCGERKPDAIGSFNAVFAFADRDELPLIKEPIEIALARQIVTPRPERLFRVHWGDTSDFENAVKHHIVLIAASLSSPGDWGAFVRGSLSEAARESVEAGRFNLFVRQDPWARKQILIVLTAPTPEALRDYILTHTDEIFGVVNDFCNEQVALWLFGSYQGRGERFDLERRIAREYGFGIRVPRMFDWEAGTGASRFLWLRALEPERWVFVWWTPIDSQSAGRVSLAWLQHVRDSLCAIYYEGDSIEPGTLTYERVTFLGRPAILYRARWRNSAKVLGGPVVGFVFDDLARGRRYVLDGAVFAPGVRKEPYLRHCEVIMRSFVPDTARFLREMSSRL